MSIENPRQLQHPIFADEAAEQNRLFESVLETKLAELAISGSGQFIDPEVHELRQRNKENGDGRRSLIVERDIQTSAKVLGSSKPESKRQSTKTKSPSSVRGKMFADVAPWTERKMRPELEDFTGIANRAKSE